MWKMAVYALAVALPLCVMAAGKDLCLIRIDSQESLEIVRNTVDCAHGIIGDKFIVHIDKKQIDNLKISGILTELICSHCDLDRLHLIRECNRSKSASALSYSPLYSDGMSHIVELEKGSLDVLAKGGYLVFSIAERETPFFYNPRHIAFPFSGDHPSDTLADRVDQDSLFNFVSRLQAFYTRFCLSDSIIQAGNWLEQKFIEFGYDDVEQQEFRASNESWGVYNYPFYNVVCYKVGTEQPDKLIVIGAHYDSITFGGMDSSLIFAPGADDNASGTAAVLELARIFRDIEFKKSIMFVAFTAEEGWGIGSNTVAENLFEDSVDLELMINMDMLSNTDDSVPDVSIAGHGTMSYYYVAAAAAERVSGLIPVYVGQNLASDDLSFSAYGYYTVGITEGDFSPYWHTNHDSTVYMDFPYFEKIVRTVAATVPIVDASPEPVTCRLYDIGDGQSLRVIWDSCFDNYSYQVVYMDNQGYLYDTADVPLFNCQYDITDLTEGITYYAGVICISDEGLPSLRLIVSSEIPLSIPRKPTGLKAMPDSASIILQWNKNIELDVSHYKVLKKIEAGDWSILDMNVVDTALVDQDIVVGEEYYYAIMAIDNDLNESDTSDVASSMAVFFNEGVLLVDETQEGDNGPTEKEQNDFYDVIFSDYELTKYFLNHEGFPISRYDIGQFNPVFWVDDDTVLNLFGESIDTVQWYLEYHCNLFLAGWETIYSITGQTYFYPGNFYYDELGISYIAQNPLTDFTGATGVGGWPDLELKPEAPGGARMPDIDIFTAAPTAEVIYTFDSYSSHPYYGNKPVGIAYDTHHGKRVILGFPLYWLTEASAQALITRVMQYFAEESILYGDVNGDWALNILDITYLIAYLYQDGPPPIDMNNGDPNGDCGINILDITYLINHLYKGGPAPVEGCVIE